MKRLQRVLALLLIVCMVFSAFPMTSFAAKPQLSMQWPKKDVSMTAFVEKMRPWLQRIDISVDSEETLQIPVGEQKDITVTSSYSKPLDWYVFTTRGVASISPKNTLLSDGVHTTILSLKSETVGNGQAFLVATDASNRWITSVKAVNFEVVEDADQPPTNQAPLFDGSFEIITDEDQPAGITITATDPDGDQVTYTHTQPSKGEVSRTDSTYVYTPNQDYNGNDSFTVTASDGMDSTSITVKVTVNPVNDAPVAVDDAGSGKVGQTLRINVLDNDYDVDSDPLSIASFTPVEGLEITQGDRYFDVKAENPGVYTFTYSVSDGSENSNEAKVVVTFTKDSEDPEDPEDPVYTVEVIDGWADPAQAKKGDKVTLTANDPSDGQKFKNWTVNSGNVSLEDANASSTSFTMPAGNVKVTANFETLSESTTYVALGDSIPVGLYYTGLSDLPDFGGSGQDTYSYIEQFRDHLASPVNFYDRSVSGHNAIDVLNQLSDQAIADEIKKADVITLCVGANDIMDALGRSFNGIDKYDVNWDDANQGRDNFEANWYQIIDGIEELNSDVTLIVMTIYNPYRSSDSYYAQVDPYFEASDSDNYGLNYIIRNTETLYDQALSDDFDYRVADVYKAFNNHANKDQLTNFYSSFSDPHPNQEGQDVIFTEHYTIYQ